MTGSAIQVESSNMQNILIAIVVICAIVYGFIEFRRINMRFQELETHILKIQEVVSSQVNNVSHSPESNNIHTKSTPILSQPPSPTPIQPPILDPKPATTESDILMDSIINDVENNLSSSNEISENISDNTLIESGLFISIESNNLVEETNTLNIDDISIKEPLKDNVIEEINNIEEDIEEEKIEEEKIEEEKIEEVVSNTGITSSEDYEQYSIRELKDKLTSMDLPTSGNKLKLIQRIVSNENKI